MRFELAMSMVRSGRRLQRTSWECQDCHVRESVERDGKGIEKTLWMICAETCKPYEPTEEDREAGDWELMR